MGDHPEIKGHWKLLREQYINASPDFRAKVARQRKDILDSGPNKLVASVSAVEGLARSKLIYCLHESTGLSVVELYEWWGLKNAEKLIIRLCKELELIPNQTFGKETWKDFQESIKYRNLLIHESTYLNGATSSRLIRAVEKIFDTLEAW